MSSTAQQLRTLIEQERQRFGVPGCAVAVVQDGEVVMAEGFGARDVGTGRAVTPDTLFPIGSSTKTFTAALCARLVDSGDLDWDRPLREYLPGFRMVDPVATELLSIRDCLSHRSGLPRHDLIWYADDGHLTRDDVIAALEHLPPSKPFRQSFQYNNLLYTTAGHLAGRLAGGTYEQAVQLRLLDPLGMVRTNFDVVATQADADHASAYRRPPGSADPEQVPYAPLQLAGPSGNINSSANEMSRWLLTLLGIGVDDRPPLLSAGVLGALRTPTMPLPAGPAITPGLPVGYGLGLVIEDYRGLRLAHHGGNIDGFSSQVLVVPDRGLGIVVLTNLDSSPLRDALPYLLCDVLLGLAPEPHGERILEQTESLRAGLEQSQRRSAAQEHLGPVRPFADYAGRYRHPGYGQIEICWDGIGLSAAYLGLTSAQLQHRHLEVFDLVLEPKLAEHQVPLQFTHDSDAAVDGFQVALEPALGPIRFARQADDGHLDDQLLDELAGTYRLGPVVAHVTRRGPRELAVSVLGSEPQALVPVHGRTFTLDGATVEFAGQGRLVTPMGDFERVPATPTEESS